MWKKHTLIPLFIFQVFIPIISRVNSSVPENTRSVLLKFDFGSGIAAGYTRVDSNTYYSNEKGYGWEPGFRVTQVSRKTKNALLDGFATAGKPFLFSVKLPEGDYHIKIKAGDVQGTSDMITRAECRRMVTERIVTRTNEIKTIEFTVNIRDSMIGGTANGVRLKSREINYLHWDNKLTLEFNGPEPKINSIEIIPVTNMVTHVFLAGNSTVVDQAYEPWAAWGQMIPVFFQPGKVSIANYAESGESLSSFIAAKRFEKVLSLMKPGDYAFVEFGHNDQKQTGEGVGAFTSYKRNLKYFINEVKNKGGIPVLVTSMHRRNFDSAGKINQTLGDYPEAVRQTAREELVALIDLNNLSKVLYEAWGPEQSKKAFVIYPANTFPGQTSELKDNTHFNPYGAYEIARCIAEGIRQNVPTLARHLKKEIEPFNPARPDEATKFYWPLSPSIEPKKPDGN